MTGSADDFEGWPDAECFALSDSLFCFADADFNGVVDLGETLAVRRRLGELAGQQAFDEAACKEGLKASDPSQRVEAEAWSACLRALCAELGAEAFKRAARQALSQPPPGAPRLVVGPVVGKVTETTARILVECDFDAAVACRLEGGGAKFSATLQMKAGVPQAFDFQGLHAGTRYEATFEGAKALVSLCSFRTVPAGGWKLGQKPPKLAVASCNKVYVSRQLKPGSPADLWHDLAQRMTNGEELDYMLHLGDNVYNDSEWYLIEQGKKALEGRTCKWGVANAMLGGLPRERWEERREDIYKLFQSAYRETWGHPPTRHVLANIPNIMLFDDHDIRDDWGDREGDLEKETADCWLGGVCYDVINAYQRQLMEDVSARPTRDWHHHAFGDLGFMFVDVRGCKTFHREEDDPSPFLGTPQWRAIEDSLKDGGAFASCKALLVLMPVPIAYVQETATMAAGRTVCDDLLGQWSATKHKAEVPRFLDTVVQWQGREANRDLLIIGGDVHEGGWTDIRDDERGSYLRQLTTSAIANKMTLPHEALAVTLTRSAAGLLDGWRLGANWKCCHYDWTNHRNYAIVDVCGGQSGTLEVSCLLAKGLRNADAGYAFMKAEDKSDPYVVMQVGGAPTQRTKTINDCLDPEWTGETFDLAAGAREHTLKLELFDYDPLTKDDPLGEAYLEFRSLPAGQPHTRTLNLLDGQGTVTVQVKFTPSNGADDMHAVIGARLIASDGEIVRDLPRRTSTDDAKQWHHFLTGLVKEVGSHGFSAVLSATESLVSKLSAAGGSLGALGGKK